MKHVRLFESRESDSYLTFPSLAWYLESSHLSEEHEAAIRELCAELVRADGTGSDRALRLVELGLMDPTERVYIVGSSNSPDPDYLKVRKAAEPRWDRVPILREVGGCAYKIVPVGGRAVLFRKYLHSGTHTAYATAATIDALGLGYRGR